MRPWIPVLLGCLVAAWAATGAEPATVSAEFIREGVATRPDDAVWKRMPETKLTLTQQLISPPVGGGSVKQVAVRAMHDGEWLAIRLEWADATADRSVGVETFRDAAAVGFPLAESDSPPSPFMGDPEHPVARRLRSKTRQRLRSCVLTALTSPLARRVSVPQPVATNSTTGSDPRQALTSRRTASSCGKYQTPWVWG